MDDSLLLAVLLLLFFAQGYVLGRLQGRTQVYSFLNKHFLKENPVFNTSSPGNTEEWIEYAGFHDFAVYAISQPQIIQQFKEATGNDLTTLVSATPLESMIETATDCDSEMLSEFLEWLKVHYWGTDKQ